MRICTISHSHIHPRQQVFFKEVTRQGHEVLMIAPGQWLDLKTQPSEYLNGDWLLATCRHTGGDNIYSFQLIGAEGLVREFSPDWVYLQQEPGSTMAREVGYWETGKKAIFTWENIEVKGMGKEDLKHYDLVVCGNPEAEALVKPHNPHTALMLQVGVDTDHFQYRPGVFRRIKVGYMGRPVPEKGVNHLSVAWPTAHTRPWASYHEMPWALSEIDVLVAYSQDKWPDWKEQAPNYTVLQALSCGCKVLVSDTPAMAYWCHDAPMVTIVPQNNLVELKRGIERLLDTESTGAGRQWVVNNFSNPVIARKLIEQLEGNNE